MDPADEIEGMQYMSDTVVTNLNHHGINFLAIDFDQTLVQVHTRGVWMRSAKELSGSVRPIFLELIPYAMQNGVQLKNMI